MQQGSVLCLLLFDVVSSGLPSELLYASDLVLIAPTMEQLGRRVAEWRVSLLTKGLKVNSGRSKVIVGSSGWNMIVKSGRRPTGVVVCFCSHSYTYGRKWGDKNCSYLDTYHLHHTRLESLEHLIDVLFYNILLASVHSVTDIRLDPLDDSTNSYIHF